MSTVVNVSLWFRQREPVCWEPARWWLSTKHTKRRRRLYTQTYTVTSRLGATDLDWPWDCLGCGYLQLGVVGTPAAGCRSLLLYTGLDGPGGGDVRPGGGRRQTVTSCTVGRAVAIPQHPVKTAGRPRPVGAGRVGAGSPDRRLPPRWRGPATPRSSEPGRWCTAAAWPRRSGRAWRTGQSRRLRTPASCPWRRRKGPASWSCSEPALRTGTHTATDSISDTNSLPSTQRAPTSDQQSTSVTKRRLVPQFEPHQDVDSPGDAPEEWADTYWTQQLCVG